jgi:DNA polymerase III subunit delta'
MDWTDIAGHAGVIKILKNMLISGRVPHALLFTGPTGLGKMLVARVFAAGLLCTGGETAAAPCGVCSACRQVRENSHPDLVILPGDGASLKIDQIRELQHEAALAPYHGGRRVLVIEEAERLTTQAANSLLKILEEPPPGTVFVLTAASAHILPPTVVSRCWQLPFYPLALAELTGFLTAGGAEPVRAEIAARLAGGRVGSALALLIPEGLAMRDQAMEIIAGLKSMGSRQIWETAAAMDKMEDAERKALLGNLNYILRDIMIILAGQERLAVNLDIIGKLGRTAEDWDEPRLLKALDELKNSRRALEANANTRLTCEALLIKLTDAVMEGNI